MATLSTLVPTNYVLTSGVNSAMTWTNALTLNSVSASTSVVSSVTANSVGYSTLSGSTINAARLNYSSIAGSSISSNTLTLSLTNTSTQNTQIYQVATTNPTTSYTVIQASHVSTGTTNNALALNPSGGNVGVGTTAPGALLDVKNGTNVDSTGQPTSLFASRIYNATNASQQGGLFIKNNWRATNATLLEVGNDLLNGSYKSYLSIDGVGNVGVGTMSPAQLLDITNADSVTPAIRIQNQFSAGYVSMGSNVGVNSFIGLQATNTTTSALGTPPLIVANTGNVGIGTTDPQTPLDIVGPMRVGYSNNSSFLINLGNTGVGGFRSGYIFGDGTSMKLANQQYGAIIFDTNNTERMRIADTGYVGIGTTAPPCPLYLNGGTGTTGWAGQTYIGNTTRGVIMGTFDNKVQVGGHAANLGAWDTLHLNSGGNTVIGTPGTFLYVSSFTTTGTVTAGANGILSVSSDYRVKENIQYVTDTTAALSSVMALKPATYRFIGAQGERLGFIAQDVEQAIPLAVDGKKYEWLWETQADGSPLLDAQGQFVWKLDADGNKIIRPRGLSDVSIMATQTLAIQDLAKQATSHATLVQDLSKKLDATQQQLAAKSASLDALSAWAHTQGYSASV